MSERADIRLFVAADLAPGASVALSGEQAHYLRAVMRRGSGDRVAVFNGRDGEWSAVIADLGKRDGHLALEMLSRPQQAPRALDLLFAPVKRSGTEWLVQKATELGAARLRPVLTRRTERARLRLDRLRMIATEAAEQCERLDVPVLDEPVKLAALLADWPADRPLLFCDERAPGPPLLQVLSVLTPPAGLLIGPEGGFDPAEREDLLARPAVRQVSLGPRILRAETAALAALATCQAHWDQLG